jgi:hypothetical protein
MVNGSYLTVGAPSLVRIDLLDIVINDQSFFIAQVRMGVEAGSFA